LDRTRAVRLEQPFLAEEFERNIYLPLAPLDSNGAPYRTKTPHFQAFFDAQARRRSLKIKYVCALAASGAISPAVLNDAQ
jgi:hypothetical protein